MKRISISILLSFILFTLGLTYYRNVLHQDKPLETDQTWSFPVRSLNARSESFWGMQVHQVFGPACLEGDIVGGKLHKPLQVDRKTGGYVVIYHCWIKGSKDGQNLKQRVDVVINVVNDPHIGMLVDSYRLYFLPLSGWRQAGLWLFWGLIVSLFYVAVLFIAFGGENKLFHRLLVDIVIFTLLTFYITQAVHWVLWVPCCLFLFLGGMWLLLAGNSLMIGIMVIIVAVGSLIYYIAQLSAWTYGHGWEPIVLGIVVYFLIIGFICLVIYFSMKNAKIKQFFLGIMMKLRITF